MKRITSDPREVKIEKGIKIPSSRPSESGRLEVLQKMEPGDSIIVPRLQADCWRFTARAKNIAITTRSISDTETRLWRIQ